MEAEQSGQTRRLLDWCETPGDGYEEEVQQEGHYKGVVIGYRNLEFIRSINLVKTRSIFASTQPVIRRTLSK